MPQSNDRVHQRRASTTLPSHGETSEASRRERCCSSETTLKIRSSDEALEFANRLSAAHDPPLPPCYWLDRCEKALGDGMTCADVGATAATFYECRGFRLPTEAEWEYAARAGTLTACYSGSIEKHEVIGKSRAWVGARRRLAVGAHRGMLAALLLTIACSGGHDEPDDGGASDAAVGPSSPGVVLARRLNELIRANYDLRCRVCPCAGFSPGNDACLGAILDQYPEAKAGILCRISLAEELGSCLSRARDCAAATACDDQHDAQQAQCPVVEGDAGGFVPPPQCRM